MRKKSKKKILRRGACPCCKSYDGVSHYSMDTFKVYYTICWNCFMASYINEKGYVKSEYSAELAKAHERAKDKPVSQEIREFLYQLDLTDEDIDKMEKS